jgi:hypothetical protein
MKNTKWLLIGIGLLILLAGGAYFGAQALVEQGEGGETADLNPNINAGLSGLNLEKSEDDPIDIGSGQMQKIAIEVNPAAELPESEEDAYGFVLRREDDRFLIGTGMPKMELQKNDDGTMNMVVTGTEGPSYEVVVTRDTQLFLDVSDMTALIDGEGGGSMQREVKPLDSLDDIDQDTQLQVWGTKRGERIVADVLVVIQPLMTRETINR